jgi:hypothetical protein
MVQPVAQLGVEELAPAPVAVVVSVATSVTVVVAPAVFLPFVLLVIST